MGVKSSKQYYVFWVELNPTKGSEMQKKRPCVIISPNEMNDTLNTVTIAPITSTLKVNYPFRINTIIANRNSSIALDHIRTVDKTRLGSKICKLDEDTSRKIKYLMNLIFCK